MPEAGTKKDTGAKEFSRFMRRILGGTPPSTEPKGRRLSAERTRKRRRAMRGAE